MWTFQGNILSPLAFWEFSWPAGLGRNSTTSQEVFVELYSVAHGVKEKGICVYVPKMKLWYWACFWKPNLLQKLRHAPQGTVQHPFLPERRITWSDDQSAVVPSSGVWSGCLRRPRRAGLWTASLNSSSLLPWSLISGLEILCDHCRPLLGQAVTEGVHWPATWAISSRRTSPRLYEGEIQTQVRVMMWRDLFIVDFPGGQFSAGFSLVLPRWEFSVVTTHLCIWGGGGLCEGEGLENIAEGCSPVPSSPHPYPISCLNPFCHVPSKTSPSFFCFSLGTRNLLPSEVAYSILRYVWLSGSKMLSNSEMGMWWEGGKVQELLNKLLF